MPADPASRTEPVAAESECRSREPIRGNAHAHQELAAHAAHRCCRYYEALHYTADVRA